MILLPIINTLNDILYPIIYMCVLKKIFINQFNISQICVFVGYFYAKLRTLGSVYGRGKEKGKKEVKKMKKSVDKGKSIWYNK